MISCVQDSKKKEKVTEEPIVEHKINENIGDIKQGLNSNLEISAANGVKLLAIMDKFYIIKHNPTSDDTSKRYFMHVTLKTGEKINMDFNYSDYSLKNDEKGEYKGVSIVVRKLPLGPIYNVLIGQFDENGRVWQHVIYEKDIH